MPRATPTIEIETTIALDDADVPVICRVEIHDPDSGMEAELVEARRVALPGDDWRIDRDLISAADRERVEAAALDGWNDQRLDGNPER